MGIRIILGMLKYSESRVTFAQLFEYTKNHRTVQFTMVEFKVSELSLNSKTCVRQNAIWL